MSSEKKLTINHAKDFLGFYRVPKKLRPIIIKEMELLKLIHINRDKCLKVINCKIKPDDSFSRLTKRRMVVGEMMEGKSFFEY